MRKTLVAALISAGALTSATAFAEAFADQARVVSARAVQERIPVTREECWNERVRAYENQTVTRTDTGAPIGPGTVLGAVVGGVIGHQFGSGRGKDAATVGGAIVGGLAGNQVDRERQGAQVTEVERVPVDRDVKRCRTVNEVREAMLGYDVVYEYRGRQFTTRTPRDPGRMLHVRVEVQPDEFAPPPPPAPQPPPPRPYPAPPAYSR